MASAYKVIAKPSTQRDIDALEDDPRREVIHAMAELRENPRPPDAILLDFHRQTYRLYVYRSMLRMVYRISDKTQRVIVLLVETRPEAYKKFQERKGPRRT